MQAKDLKNLIGQEVAVGAGWGRPTLAKANHRYRMIDGPFDLDHRWVENERGGADRVSEYVAGRGKLWLAEYLGDPDGDRDPEYVESKRILGTWADHLAAKAEDDLERAENLRQRKAAEAEAEAKSDRINAAMESAGIDWRTSLHPSRENVPVPLTVLFELIERAGLETEVPSDV